MSETLAAAQYLHQLPELRTKILAREEEYHQLFWAEAGTPLLAEQSGELRRLKALYAHLLREVTETLALLPPREYETLHLAYVSGLTEEAIAEKTHYSTRQVQRIKRRGLELVQEILDAVRDTERNG